MDAGVVRLSSRGSAFAIRRRFDIAALRGHRLRISVRARTDSPPVVAELALLQGGSIPNYGDVVKARTRKAAAWTPVQVVADIDRGSLHAEITLAIRGSGNAWFDDVTVEDLGRSPLAAGVRLSGTQVDNLTALARAITLVRYRHPSDQAANLDWDEYWQRGTTPS